MKSLFSDVSLARIQRSGVIAVLVIERVADAVPLAKALLDGGVDIMELTLRTPVALECLSQIRKHIPEMLAGVGTILRPEQVSQAIDAGAAFGVAPGTNPAVIRQAIQAGLPFAPGVMTPTDIEIALSEGCREMKFFPAELTGGQKMLASLRAPFAHLGVQFIPLGGITTENLESWLTTPGILAAGGSWLAPQAAVQSGNWTAIQQEAAKARAIINRVRPTTKS
jgi:2-dehydro-3-deoxyphosphogluconate aldolase/(4S)-4-hydroxy-2-oxoglutarate aldolase